MQLFQSLNILHTRLENAYSCPKYSFLWYFTPILEQYQCSPQNSDPCMEAHYMKYRSSKSVYWAQHNPKYKVKHETEIWHVVYLLRPASRFPEAGE